MFSRVVRRSEEGDDEEEEEEEEEEEDSEVGNRPLRRLQSVSITGKAMSVALDDNDSVGGRAFDRCPRYCHTRFPKTRNARKSWRLEEKLRRRVNTTGA